MAEPSDTTLQTEALLPDGEQMPEAPLSLEPPSLDDAFFEESLDWEAPDSTTEMPVDYAAKAMRSARLRELKRSLVKRRADLPTPRKVREAPRGYAESILDGVVALDKVAGGWEAPDHTAVISNVQSGVHIEHLLGSIDEEIAPEDDSLSAPAPPPEPLALELPPAEEATPEVVERVKPLDKPGRDAESMIMMSMAAVLLLMVVVFLVYGLAAIVLG